jgi:hypothetical protein
MMRYAARMRKIGIECQILVVKPPGTPKSRTENMKMGLKRNIVKM